MSLPDIHPGPDILDVVPPGAIRDQMVQDRQDSELQLLKTKLPPKHFKKAGEIPLPGELWTWDWSLGGPLLWGPKGTGKTQAAVGMVVQAVKDRQVQAQRVAWVATSQLFIDLRRAVGDKDVKVPAIAAMRQAELVVLDDLAKTRWTDYVEEQLFTMIDDLYMRDVKVIGSSNVHPDSLDIKLGEFAADRLAEVTTPFHMDGKSHRRKR